MKTNQIAHIASLVGEPARTGMLMELMDGRSLTALELAKAGRVSPQTASRHLAQLVDSGLLRVEQRGRHRYHRLASGDVARLLESLMQLATQTPESPAQRTVLPGPRDAALRAARTCYDHLAGRLGVAIADRLQATGAVAFDGDCARVTERADGVLAGLGIATPEAATASRPGRRLPCRPCLDWSERRPHVAGRLGAVICAHSLERGWLARRAGTRALDVTPKGVMVLREWLGHDAWR